MLRIPIVNHFLLFLTNPAFLPSDECDVYTSLVEASKSAVVQIMPNHRINDMNEVEGFRFTCDSRELASVMPFGRRMFQKTTMVECFPPPPPSSSDGGSDAQVNPNVNRLALAFIHRQVAVRDALVNIVQSIHRESRGHEASFDCMPTNTGAVHEGSICDGGGDFSQSLGASFFVRKTADSR